MKELTLWQRIYIYLLLPYGIIKVAINYLVTGKERNGIHTGAPLQGKKNGAFSKEIDLLKIKEVSKRTGYTINDIMLAVTGMSLKKYLT